MNGTGSAPPTLAAKLGEQLRDELTDARVPGGTVALGLRGQTFTGAHGLTRSQGLPASENTLFRVASITKPILATAILRLVDRGAVALGDTIHQLVPGFRLADQAAAEAVTVLDVLTHQGGWYGDFFEDTGDDDDALAQHVQRMATLPQLVDPGTSFSYSNAGYCVLGHLLERLVGSSFEAAITNLVLEPLGIRTRFRVADAITGPFAIGHRQDGTIVDRWDVARCARPSGGLVATPTELVRFAAALIDPDDAWLSQHARRQITTPYTDAVGTNRIGDQFGLGWFLRRVDGTTVLSHAGDMLGQHALLVCVPDAQFVLAVATNSPSGERATERIATWALRECLGVNLAPPPASEAPRCAGALLTGHYESSLHTIAVTRDSDSDCVMTLEPKPLVPGWPPAGAVQSSRIRLLEDDTILLTDPPLAGSRARIIRDAHGAITHLRVVGRLAAANDPGRPAGPAGSESR